MRKTVFVSFLLLLMMSVSSAYAAKFGGGKSFGFKKPIQYRALNQKPAPNQKAAPTSKPQPAAGKQRNWGGILGGLLAGGLLAALFFGGAFEGMTPGDWLVLLLIAGGVWWFLRRRARVPQPALATEQATPQARAGFEDLKIGGKVADIDQADNAASETDELPPPPPWFEVGAFESTLVANFKAVQQAWDAGDVETLRSFCSDACFEAIRDEIRPGTHQTEIEQVTAQVIDWDYVDDQFVVSVRFSGFARENDAPARGFTEVWHLAKPVDGQGRWKIIGVQQL